jgi:16S rRNA G966 N2-methylase RsmD
MSDYKLITVHHLINKYSSFLFPNELFVDKKKLMIYDISVYSMSQPRDSDIVCKTIKDIFIEHFNYDKSIINDMTITDGTSNIGGNTLAFSKCFNKVNSIELDKDICDALKHNCMEVYKRDNITFYNADCMKVIPTIKQNVIFIDPPWGGYDYKKVDKLSLFLGDKNIFDVVMDWYDQSLAELFVVKYPNNFDIDPFLKEKKFTNIFLQKLNKYSIMYICKK